MIVRGRAPGRPDGGFTLVELLIVIVVLGVLSGIVLFGLGRFRSDANAAACQADVSAVTAAADAYQAVTGNYPREMPDLTVGQYLMSAPGSGSYTFDATSRSVVRSPACADLSSTAVATVQPTPGSSGSATPTPSPSRTATPTPTPTPSATAPSATAACASAVAIDNSWPQGYQAAITVTNRGSSTLTNWVATWTVPSGVTLNNGWYATVSQTGSTMRADAPDWSPTLAPGASWVVGFIANGPSAPPPSAVKLNGAGCG
jgi:prepilin-type N-terminal cleavage/methylation domain-containing protein